MDQIRKIRKGNSDLPLSVTFRRASSAEGRPIPPSFGTSASSVSRVWQSCLVLFDLFSFVLGGLVLSRKSFGKV
ncbi:hypothetical protein BDV27DRAFT_126601 [Aspergillus caelatus]|uniref:Uncharacterized protein n=1 Tax=Aspergillus caelatus TaxID=61420 RepID=A0A5N7A6W4_9EURO|nr:uncharacterized protein BDV27DRAFT_126601 [Aspergillus caelatus]KAE8365562.1 hypothetical protein BDV27DRAFT_126601 [Aspergillus caelatus]